MSEVLQQAFAAQRHGGIELAVDNIERLADARFAAGTETVDEGASDVGAVSAEADRLEHVLAGTDAAVEMYFDVAADRIDDFRQGADR